MSSGSSASHGRYSRAVASTSGMSLCRRRKCSPPSRNSRAKARLPSSDQPPATTRLRRRATRSRAPMAWPHSASSAWARPSSAWAVSSRPLSSSALAATVASPSRAPCTVTRKNTPCSSSERIRMSRFTASSGRHWRQWRSGARRNAPACRASSPRHSSRPSSAPLHSAITEARAAPATPHSRPSTNHRSSSRLSRLMLSRIASAARAFCAPRNQPISAWLASIAGRPSRRRWKYSRARLSSAADGSISARAAPLNGSAARPSSIASAPLSSPACSNSWRNAAPSPRPLAWAAKPVVPMRRKPQHQISRVYRLAPTATAPN